VKEEAERAEKTRPFPYVPTVDPVKYSDEYLSELTRDRGFHSIGKDISQALYLYSQITSPAIRLSIFKIISALQAEINGLDNRYKFLVNYRYNILSFVV